MLEQYKFKIINSIPKWTLLKSLEGNSIVRSAFVWLMIVPICARLFGSLNEHLVISYGEQDYTFHLSLPFSWQLFFYSACFYVLANLIVKFMCPSAIMEHRDYSSFSECGKSWPQINGYLIKMFYSNVSCSFEEKNKKPINGYLKIFHSENITDEEYDNKVLKFLQLNRSGNDENQAYWYVRTVADGNSNIFRLLATIFYLFGFALFSIVALQNVIFVIKATFA